jgi:stearoyl-CoA desaturase (delta-9 desaturase)
METQNSENKELNPLSGEKYFQIPSKISTNLPKIPGVITISPFARRLQRSIALAVVVIPFLGFVVAMILAWKYGISRVEIGILIGMYTTIMIGVTVGFHRYFAHRAFQANGVLKVILAILGSMAAQGPILFWVASHRCHHAYSDQPGDPHSPHLHGKGIWNLLRGLWHAHIGWMFSDKIANSLYYAPDLLRDLTLFKINQLYFVWVSLGLIIPAVLGGVLMGTWIGVFKGFLWGGLVRIFLVNQACWSVGSIGHTFGSRPFNTHDYSANNFWVALIAFGEGLQNNHHAFPSSAKHGLRWWEPDLSAWVIRILEMVGLAWDVKTPTVRMIAEAKKSY